MKLAVPLFNSTFKICSSFHKKVRKLTSSNTKLINLKERRRVRVISETGTPIFLKGVMNHHSAKANCSGGVVVKHKLALWNICTKSFQLERHIERVISSLVLFQFSAE
jgi:hypothetical protein